MTAAVACAGRLVGSALLWAALTTPAAPQVDGSGQAAIRAALTQWTTDFNAGAADKVCGLFAPDLVAQVRGQPERGYAELCDLLQRSLRDRSKTYKYELAIKEVLVAGDLAVVRLTWTLTVRSSATGEEAKSVEHGLDIFRRQPDGGWKISRFMSYDNSP